MSTASPNVPSSASAPDIAAIVRQVIEQLGASNVASARPAAAASPSATSSFAGANGVFGSVDEAVRAATEAFEQLERLGVEGRKKAIAHVRRIAIDDAEELGAMEFAEPVAATVALAIGWALLTPLLVRLAQRFDGYLPEAPPLDTVNSRP